MFRRVTAIMTRVGQVEPDHLRKPAPDLSVIVRKSAFDLSGAILGCFSGAVSALLDHAERSSFEARSGRRRRGASAKARIERRSACSDAWSSDTVRKIEYQILQDHLTSL